MHGQPTWSYLYRRLIPRFVGAGLRVVAPDLVGFGRSDKPARREDYTYARHVQWMHAWLARVGLSDVTLLCHDWGGLIGLRLVAAEPERFARVVVANTGLPDARDVPDSAAASMRSLYDSLPVVPAQELPDRFADSEGAPAFLYWIKHCAEHPDFRASDVMRFVAGCELGDEEARAYDAPFPDDRYMAGARQFPSLVPLLPDDPAVPDNRRAWEVLRTFEKPFLTAFSDRDPVTAGGEKRFQEEVPGAANVRHVTIPNAGHFLQEDNGEALADAVLAFVRAHPVG